MAVDCKQLTIYAKDMVSFTIDDREVIGLWEGDDVISVERQTDLGTPMTGADGSSIVSFTSDQSALLTVKLQANSAANTYFEKWVKARRMGSTRLLRVAVRDTATGEGGGCTSAVIVKEPSKSWGGTATEREWQLFCNCWQENDITYNPAA